MIEFNSARDIPEGFTGICKVYNNSIYRKDIISIRHYKNGRLHNESGPAINWSNTQSDWYYEGKCFGNDNFYSDKSWQERVRELKLEIFK